ncbi:MAG: SDR family oxidoreductase [Chloroflexi bacterium]|nr:MAG: SDR family oxidoreductase [Chloroflexota bacterium]
MTDLAVIMGATGGLGSAIVDAFASRGDRVIAVARSRAQVSQLASKYPLSPSPSGGGQRGGVTGDTADLTSRLAVDDLWERIDRMGSPRWVVNATGGYRAGKVVDTTPDDFSFMMDLNLGTAWWSCRAAARRLQAGGAIVNVASRAALTGSAGSSAYAVSKAGVVRLTEVLAAELKGAAELKASGVRVNVIVPAIIDTAVNRQVLPEKLMQKAVAPAEIAAVIAYLCSDAAAAITGATIPVYGKY